MSERIVEFMNQIINLLFNCLYIGILVTSYRYVIYKSQINYLVNTIDEVKIKQDKLFQIIIKLRNIIKVDGDLTNNQTTQLKKIRKELHSINCILNIKTNLKNTDSSENLFRQLEIDSATKTDDNIDEEISNDDNHSAIILPISLHKQQHITFPNYFVFNKINFKKTKLSNNNHKLEFIGDDIRVISNELAKFLNFEYGTCIEFNEVFEMIYNYIQETEINNIGDDPNLCKLFGINENEDYEFTDTILIKILTKLLEPHFRKIYYTNENMY
jgi:hypothetical protein